MRFQRTFTQQINQSLIKRLRLISVLKLVLLITVILSPHQHTLSAPLPVGIPDRRFGVIEAYEAPGAASELGAGWTRITFEWNQIQPSSPAEWIESPVPDSVLDRERAAGRQLIGLIVTTPGWATDMSRGPGVPQGLYLPNDDPNNQWAIYLRKLMTHHRDRIQHWIIWNEPDIWETGFQSWGGSVEDFVQLIKVAYDVAHQVNPEMVIHMAAVTHWWDANYGRELFMRRFLKALTSDTMAAAHNHYFDAITLHVYFNSDSLYDLSRFYLGLLSEFGIYKPLWIVETNAAPSDDPSWPVANPQFSITQDEQAMFIIQDFAMALAAGAQRIAVYKMADLDSDTANPEPFGLIRRDGSRRPAFRAYQVATRYMAGFQSATLDRRDEAAVVTISRTQGWTTALWARGPQDVSIQIPAHTTSAQLIDWRGNQRSIAAQDGAYIVTLPASQCTHPANPCLIGGAPYLIVEGNVAANISVQPPPTERPTPGHTPMPSPTATLSPTMTLTPTRTPTPSPTIPTATPSPIPTKTPTIPLPLTPTLSPTPKITDTPILLTLQPSVQPSYTKESDDNHNRPAWLFGFAGLVILGGSVILISRQRKRKL